MAQRDLVVRFIGDDRDLRRAIGNTERSVERLDNRTATFGKNIGRAFAAAGIAVGTAEVFRLAGDAVDAASDLNEQLSRTEVILGDNAQETIEWSKTTATAFGISQRAALAATATFAGLFQTVGVEQDAAGEFSRQIVQLAADLASLQNSSPEQALTALRSGLAGESEPLRRFNIFLSEARVNVEALTASGKRNVTQLTQQEKTLARFNLILRDAAPAIGDFERTSDSLANQQRVLRANFDDLSTSLGNVLVPVLTDAAEAANLLFLALEQFRGVDFSPGFDFPDPPDWLRGLSLAPVSPAAAVALTVKRGIDALTKDAQDIEAAAGPGKGIGEDIVRRQVEAAEDAEKAAKAARKAQLRQQKAFQEFATGLGLKLDKAQLTEGLTDDIAALRELEKAIVRQIEREGQTFKLVDQLTATRLEINSLVQAQADDARQAGVDAFNATVDALDLNLEIAEASKSLADDQAALRAIEQAILARIAAEGESTDLLRRLFQVRQEQQEVARQLAEQSRERRQSQQFKELGLTEEGDRPTPGVGALSRRLGNLREQIKGTTLDTEKTRRELDRIAEVLSGKFGAVGKEVRDAILQMFNDIAGALDEGGKKGPLTKTSGLNTKKILAGLGLSDEEINELRGRLSSVNTAGRQLATISSTVPGGGRGVPRGAQVTTGIFVESHTTINLDGQQVAKVVTKQQQKARRRNPRQKRGPNRNI